MAASDERASSLDIKLKESADREKELNSELSELKNEFDYVKIAANLLGQHLISEKERVSKEEQLNKELLAAKEKVIGENNKLKEQLDNYAALLEEIHSTHFALLIIVTSPLLNIIPLDSSKISYYNAFRLVAACRLHPKSSVVMSGYQMSCCTPLRSCFNNSTRSCAIIDGIANNFEFNERR